jgi:hypothetical protein
MDHTGSTRLIVSVPESELSTVHQRLLQSMQGPVSVLYRQVVDRVDPKPQGSPPRDFLALGLAIDRVSNALVANSDLVYHDARCEVWLRGVLHEQLVIDPDGLLYCYPDDPTFRDALASAGVDESEFETLLERDYVKHVFHAACDGVEQSLIEQLNLTEVASTSA